MSALVTFGRNRIGHNVARSLSQKGVRVVTSDEFPFAMTRFSRYSSGFFVYPSPFRREEEFIETLVEGLKRNRCDVLLPCHQEVLPVARNLEKLSRYAEVPVSDYETLMRLHDKFSLFELARELGIPSPETWTADSLDERTPVPRDCTEVNWGPRRRTHYKRFDSSKSLINEELNERTQKRADMRGTL